MDAYIMRTYAYHYGTHVHTSNVNAFPTKSSRNTLSISTDVSLTSVKVVALGLGHLIL